MVAKYKLREEFRVLRGTILPAYRKQAASKAAAILTNTSFFIQGQHIACYYPFKDEFDSFPIIEAIWQAKKECYLPIILDDEKSLRFIKYNAGDSLQLNRYTILEPQNRDDEITLEALDLIITPLLAFDRNGHRLGTGGGYYDRTFSRLQHNKNRTSHMIGLAYAVQEVRILPTEKWDIRLDGIVTEQCFINVNVDS